MTNDKHPSISVKDFQSEAVPDWCAGCGDFGILRAIERALVSLGRRPEEVAVFGGIGCSGKSPYYLSTYGVHTLHGRVLPFAFGAKLANPALTVLALGGDGDGLGIGGGHFLNAGRRNLDLTYILFNNGVYGLTKGQAAPTLRAGDQTKAMPSPNWQGEVNPLMLALTAGFSWVGRGYAYDVKQLSELVVQAITQPGLAYLDVLQPCPVYNDLYTKEWFAGDDREPRLPRLYTLETEGYEPRVPKGASESERQRVVCEAYAKSQEWGARIPTGVFLQDLSRPFLLDELAARQPGYPQTAPATRCIADAKGQSTADLSAVLERLTVVRSEG